MSGESKSSAETRLKSEKGHQLYCRYWNADNYEDKPQQYKALVFIIHGLGEHCLCYNELAAGLISQGYYVFSHDHVGHGQSEGDRVHVTDFQLYVDDVLQHIDKVKVNFPDLPVFIIGHSMGGTVAILCGMTRPDFFKGVVLIAPLVIPDKNTATPLRVFLGKMAAKVFPQMHVAKIDTKTISRDPVVVKKYEDDPLIYHEGLKGKWCVAMLEALERLKTGMEGIKWPFFVLHGTKDALCDVEGSKLLHEKASSQDKTIHIFQDAFHQLHHELEPVKKETHTLIQEWLNKHL